MLIVKSSTPGGIIVASGAALLLLLTGCSAPSESAGPPTASDGTAVEIDAWALERDGLLEDYPDADVPELDEIEVVRAITLDEADQVYGDCLNEAGIDATVTEDGLRVEVAAGQDYSYRLESLICHARYPLQDKFNSLSQDQIGRLYDYQTGPLTECLNDAGFSVPDPPTKQSFVEQYGSSVPWTAYQEVNVTEQAWQDINEQCPQLPAGLWE
jgi:hypothetical protein